MAALKLVNNTGLRSERNLCYVNTELQLLYSIPDVKEFFSSNKYRENYPEKLPICDELARMFRTHGKFPTTAAVLRQLVGRLHNREDICDGEQQDLEEFHTLLLRGIANEVAKVGAQQARFISKFRGREANEKAFLHTRDGCCNHGHTPRTEEEGFQAIKLDIPSTSSLISLNILVSNHYEENSSTFSMKCSDCCTHPSNCPRTGKCKLREAISQKQLISTPDILYIQLLRFEDYQNPKVKTKVIPENVLILPNQDKYKLVSIGNHLGTYINNGHYQALIKTGTTWVKADDTSTVKTSLSTEITEKNYLFVYKKFSTTTPLVATNYWEEVYEDQPVPPGLHVQLNTRTGRKFAKSIDDECETNGQRDKKVNGKKKFTEHKLKCSNCKLMFENLQHHLEASLICKQTLNEKITDEKVKQVVKPMKSKEEESMNKLGKFLFVKGSMKFEEIEEGKIQCGGCKGKFSRIVGHLTKSIECTQNIDLEEFKSKWTRFCKNKRNTQYYQNQKKNNEE